MIDSLAPQIEEARSEGAHALLKRDGERNHSQCKVVVNRGATPNPLQGLPA